jgi:hypothetical protein
LSHPLYEVADFEIISQYTLRVAFDDGTQQVIDFEPVLYGEMYVPLRDFEFFNRVVLDEEIKMLIWPNGTDFDPWMLHEWPRLIDQLAVQVKTWDL